MIPKKSQETKMCSKETKESRDANGNQEDVEVLADIDEPESEIEEEEIDEEKMSRFETLKEDKNYEINRKGEVRNKTNETVKQNSTDQYGYLYVTLGQTKYKLHRLLASRFIPNPRGKPMVMFRNGDKTDIKLKNLRWCDRAQLSVASQKNQPTGSGKAYRRVLQKSQTGEILRPYDSAAHAARAMKVKTPSIRKACENGTNCKGYKWAWAETSPEYIPDAKLEWKPIFLWGKPTCYAASILGDIKNTDTERKLQLNTSGAYVTVGLHFDGAKHTFTVHSLVAACFHEKTNPADVVDHRNQNKHDNKASNLRYITPAGNTAAALGIKVTKMHRDSKEVARTFDSITAASEALGMPANTLKNKFQRGETYEHDGFIYDLEDETKRHPRRIPKKRGGKQCKYVHKTDAEDGQLEDVFDSITEASQHLDIDPSSLAKYLRHGGEYHADGFIYHIPRDEKPYVLTREDLAMTMFLMPWGICVPLFDRKAADAAIKLAMERYPIPKDKSISEIIDIISAAQKKDAETKASTATPSASGAADNKPVPIRLTKTGAEIIADAKKQKRRITIAKPRPTEPPALLGKLPPLFIVQNMCDSDPQRPTSSSIQAVVPQPLAPLAPTFSKLTSGETKMSSLPPQRVPTASSANKLIPAKRSQTATTSVAPEPRPNKRQAQAPAYPIVPPDGPTPQTIAPPELDAMDLLLLEMKNYVQPSPELMRPRGE